MRWLVVAIALASGCGDNLTGIELEDFDRAELQARCIYLTRCGLFTETAVCDAYFQFHRDESRIAAVRAEQMRYDAVAALACLDEMVGTLTCDGASREARVPSEACRKMFRGDLSGGEECAFDEECKSGDCDVAACPAETCCYGRCTARKDPADVGGPCETKADCIDDAWCSEDGTCQALVPAAGPCTLDEQCDYGLGCIGATEFMPGACRALPLFGEPCPYKRCAEIGARCVSGTCVPLGLPGDACEAVADCSPYSECDLGAKLCRESPTEIGAACNRFCAGDVWCDLLGTKTCRELKENTTPCFLDGQCASGYCAEGVFYQFCTDREVCY